VELRAAAIEQILEIFLKLDPFRVRILVLRWSLKSPPILRDRVEKQGVEVDGRKIPILGDLRNVFLAGGAVELPGSFLVLVEGVP